MDRTSWTAPSNLMQLNNLISGELDDPEQLETLDVFTLDSFFARDSSCERLNDTQLSNQAAFASLPAMSRAHWVQAYLDAASHGAEHQEASDYADATAKLAIEMLD